MQPIVLMNKHHDLWNPEVQCHFYKGWIKLDFIDFIHALFNIITKPNPTNHIK